MYACAQSQESKGGYDGSSDNDTPILLPETALPVHRVKALVPGALTGAGYRRPVGERGWVTPCGSKRAGRLDPGKATSQRGEKEERGEGEQGEGKR